MYDVLFTAVLKNILDVCVDLNRGASTATSLLKNFASSFVFARPENHWPGLCVCRKLGDQHLCEYTSDLFSASRLACRAREGTMCSYGRRFFVSRTSVVRAREAIAGVIIEGCGFSWYNGWQKKPCLSTMVVRRTSGVTNWGISFQWSFSLFEF